MPVTTPRAPVSQPPPPTPTPPTHHPHAHTHAHTHTSPAHAMLCHTLQVRWNNIHPSVFLSSSADWTVKIWDSHDPKVCVRTGDAVHIGGLGQGLCTWRGVGGGAGMCPSSLDQAHMRPQCRRGHCNPASHLPPPSLPLPPSPPAHPASRTLPPCLPPTLSSPPPAVPFPAAGPHHEL